MEKTIEKPWENHRITVKHGFSQGFFSFFYGFSITYLPSGKLT